MVNLQETLRRFRSEGMVYEEPQGSRTTYVREMPCGCCRDYLTVATDFVSVVVTWGSQDYYDAWVITPEGEDYLGTVDGYRQMPDWLVFD